MFRIWLLMLTLLGPLLAKSSEGMARPVLDLNHQQMGYAGFRGDRGEVAYRQSGLSLGNALFDLSYNHWAFQWRQMEESRFSGGVATPLKELHAYRLGAKLPRATASGQMVMTQLFLNSTFEKEHSKSYGATAALYTTLPSRGEGVFTLGAVAYYHPVRTIGLPIASYNYRMRSREGWQASVGFPSNYIGYHTHHNWMWMANLSFNTATIRLRDESPIAPGGYLSLSDYLGGFGFRYTPTNHLTLTATLNATLYRDILTYDASGSRLDTHRLNPSYGARMGLRYRF